MDALSFLLMVTAAVCLEGAYVPSISNTITNDALPEPEFYIHFPRTTEIGCYKGSHPPDGAKGVFFMLDRMLSHGHTCRFITYNMKDYQGTIDAYRFRRLITMYPEIVRPDRKLQCDNSSEEPTQIKGADFEISRNGVTKTCRMVEGISSRSGVPGSGPPRETYKRLPGGLLLLRASYELPKQSRFRRNPQPLRTNSLGGNKQSNPSHTSGKATPSVVHHKHKLERKPATRNLFEKFEKKRK